MKVSKFMMSLSAAVFGGVMYMQLAGACSRMQAAVLGTAMLVCMAICYADLCAAKRRRAAEKAKKARFDALLLERWQARQEAKKQEGGHAEIQRVGN